MIQLPGDAFGANLTKGMSLQILLDESIVFYPRNMKPHQHNRNILWLLGAVFLAVVFFGILSYYPAFTGNDELNGLCGVCLGLFISSLPTANFLDMLLFKHAVHHWRSLKLPDIIWVILNASVLLIGTIVVMIGTKLFF
jgi:hypothetical protein